MKKRTLSLFLCCAFLLLLLSACAGGNAGKTAGKVTATLANEAGGVSAFLVEPNPATEQKKPVGILISNLTDFLSPLNDLDPLDFVDGLIQDVAVTVTYNPSSSSKVTLDGTEVKAYEATEVIITGYRTDKTTTLKDGTTLALWQYASATGYALEDGTELLVCGDTQGPENTSNAQSDCFEDITPAAQKAVSAYYQEQGLLYDLPAQLEQAYEAYRQTKDPKAFPYYLAQAVVPTASNDTLLCFQTVVTFPIDGKTSYEQQTSAVFDRNTGEQIDITSLFTCPKEELGSRLLDISTVSDPTLREEMEKAFQPEYITLYPDRIQLCFPQGTLPSQKHTCLWDIDYKGELSKLMEPWAIPKAPDKG